MYMKIEENMMINVEMLLLWQPISTPSNYSLIVTWFYKELLKYGRTLHFIETSQFIFWDYNQLHGISQ